MNEWQITIKEDDGDGETVTQHKISYVRSDRKGIGINLSCVLSYLCRPIQILANAVVVSDYTNISNCEELDEAEVEFFKAAQKVIDAFELHDKRFDKSIQ